MLLHGGARVSGKAADDKCGSERASERSGKGPAITSGVQLHTHFRLPCRGVDGRNVRLPSSRTAMHEPSLEVCRCKCICKGLISSVENCQAEESCVDVPFDSSSGIKSLTVELTRPYFLPPVYAIAIHSVFLFSSPCSLIPSIESTNVGI